MAGAATQNVRNVTAGDRGERGGRQLRKWGFFHFARNDSYLGGAPFANPLACERRDPQLCAGDRFADAGDDGFAVALAVEVRPLAQIRCI
jgi:hypothetical protein